MDPHTFMYVSKLFSTLRFKLLTVSRTKSITFKLSAIKGISFKSDRHCIANVTLHTLPIECFCGVSSGACTYLVSSHYDLTCILFIHSVWFMDNLLTCI